MAPTAFAGIVIIFIIVFAVKQIIVSKKQCEFWKYLRMLKSKYELTYWELTGRTLTIYAKTLYGWKQLHCERISKRGIDFLMKEGYMNEPSSYVVRGYEELFESTSIFEKQA